MRTRSGYLGLVASCWLGSTGCSYDSDAERSAQAVASSMQCGVEEVAPELLMRLSRYSSAGMPGDIVSVIELCHPERGCSAAASYQNGMAPLVVSREPELVIEVPMATHLRVFRDETWIQGERTPLRIVAKTIRTNDELDAARKAFGLPPGRSSEDSCRRDLAIRPFYRGTAF